jgi:hypothetical protein
MVSIYRSYAYFTNSIIKVCPPAALREHLKEEINKGYKYITYPKARQILHKDIGEIDIYGDNTLDKNVEHIFPQSKFKERQDKNKMRSDLHNLYLCNTILNNQRQNFKYIDSSEVSEHDNIKILDLKGKEVTSQSEMFKKNGYLMITNRRKKTFIPTTYSRGKISRSLSYFAIKYNFVKELEEVINMKTLIEWNLKDPVDNEEYLKNIKVYKHQGNINPFILEPSLVHYCFSDIFKVNDETLNKERVSNINPLYTIDWLLKELGDCEKINGKKDINIKKLSAIYNQSIKKH